MTADNTPHPHPDRSQLYADMAPLNLSPLWESLHQLVPPVPHTPCVPAHWSYEAVRPFLMRSGEVITAQEAVRRVLILENPALKGSASITQSLYAGLQLILPGEVAPSHRHSQSALRFIVEGQGAFTAVDGERTTMQVGDFVITPSWTWHDHGYDSQEEHPKNPPSARRNARPADHPMVWLDGLDIPLVGFLDAGFAENGSAAQQTLQRTEGASFAQFGHNMAPVRHDGQYLSPQGQTSPLFNYPYSRTREALHQLERSAAVDAWDGFKLAYTNPRTGGSPMPTMATYMQRLPAGFVGRPYRQTDGTVFSVVEGCGEALISRGEVRRRFAFKPRDTFVVPSWYTLELHSAADPEGAVLFSFSDRPVQQALGLHREERLSVRTEV